MRILILVLSVITIALYADDADLSKRASSEGWTFKFKKPDVKYSLGLKKEAPQTGFVISPDKSFLKSVSAVPSSLDLGAKFKLSPVLDQGACGSCVYHSVMANLLDSYRIHGVVLPPLSRQYLMDCAAVYSCDGSTFDLVATGLGKKGGSPLESTYPYVAKNESCKPATGLEGRIDGYKIIDNSAKSVIGALNQDYPVSATIGADDALMAYSSGIYNACSSQPTNHEVVVQGYDCEGDCLFDAKGNLPPGKGFYLVRNSWGLLWGENGYIRIRITSKTGTPCNNIAEEAAVLVIAQTPPAPTPAPVDGGWSPFGPWSFCENGFHEHIRTCTNPVPANGGKFCIGPSSEVAPCSPLPVPGGIPPWFWITLGVLALGIPGLFAYLAKKNKATLGTINQLK